MPVNWNTNGDGITLFDEYRGFLVDDGSDKEVFQRLKPGNPRKLFVFLTDTDKALHQKGVQLYQRASGVLPVFIHGINRMEIYGGTLFPRWVNFNSTPYTNGQQCAVWIDDVKNDSLGKIFLEKDEPLTAPQTPQTIWKLNVSRAACAQQVNFWASLLPPRWPIAEVTADYQAAAKETGLDPATVGSDLAARTAQLVNTIIVFKTMHELGHSTGARHHCSGSGRGL